MMFLEKLGKEYEKIKDRIEEKLKEFEKNKDLKKEDKFVELCFCILVANNRLEKTKYVWERIGKKFLTLSEKELKDVLKSYGMRFYNKRAKYIIKARNFIDEIDKNVSENREWFVENIKGIGYKEASHFLRNMGYKNFAILDRHVMRFLIKNKIIEKQKNLTKKNYLEIEEKLKDIAKMLSTIVRKEISLAELDLLIFYVQTGKICEK
jgi:N-glycosylase/DNA lyase